MQNERPAPRDFPTPDRDGPVELAFEEDEEPFEPEEVPEYPRDAAIDGAKKALRQFFTRRENKASIFYLTQLQVIFERAVDGITTQPTFHWITAKAISELVPGVLRDEYRLLRPGEASQVRFIFHPSSRYRQRAINRKLAIIRQFSEPHVARACGAHAEVLFSRALLIRGFQLISRNAKEYRGRLWTETGHDLDFIFEKDGITYGCEIKNRFEYITREEMQLKIRLCKFLGVRPLFILRSAPKNYINQVQANGGFTKIYDWHIYPYGLEALTEATRKELPGMPAYCVRDLPETIMDKFVDWHTKQRGRS